MSLQAHLSELNAKHRALEAALAEAINHPASTDAEIAELKRKKLKIKDEITRLQHQHAA
ncbi:YdcH family protein [Aestuariivirga sp.]|uniref:YdcH family protein n=1 Tax=Aestuariivirga sp. TaxID=2650926 RepID=UPI003BA96430